MISIPSFREFPGKFDEAGFVGNGNQGARYFHYVTF